VGERFAQKRVFHRRAAHMYDNPGEFSSDVYCTVGLRHIRDTRMFYKKYFSLALGCTYPVVRAIIIMSPVRLG
jgi:hypothetical protein